MRIAVLGAGSLGTITGALLSKGGEDVTLIDTYEEHVNALNMNGAKIEGGLELVVPVKASLIGNLDGYFDLLIFQTKHEGIRSALEGIKDHIHKDTIFLTLQNGIPEDLVSDIVGKERVIGGSVGWGATFKGPGVSELTSNADQMDIIIGELDGEITDRIKEVERIMSKVCKITVSDNLMGIKLSKLVHNCKDSGMSAVTGAKFGEIADNFTSFTCQAYISMEAVKIMEAANIEPFTIHNFELNENVIGFKTKEDLEKLQSYYQSSIKKHYNVIASMLQDIRRGKKTEINEINGKMVEYGEKYNIPTPFNAKVVEIVSKIEKGELEPSWDNLALFDFPALD